MSGNDFMIPLLAKQLEYSPITGVLTWLPKDGTCPTTRRWNTRYAGQAAGAVDSCGYVSICFQRVRKKHTIRAHRVAWYFITGHVPTSEIDHIDGNRSNNRADNLRDVSRSINQRNTTQRSTNTSGITGVSWNKSRKKWTAYAREGTRLKHLGRFTHKEDAANTVKAFREGKGYTDRCYTDVSTEN